MLRIGLISDTHGLLRPQAIELLRGCGHIIHAGDVDRPSVLEQLKTIAPVTVVRGNNDKGEWATSIPETQLLEFESRLIYVIHDISLIDLDPPAAKMDVVVYGHSHKPHVETRDGVLYINAGSAGPRRFKLPITVAELAISHGRISATIQEVVVSR